MKDEAETIIAGYVSYCAYHILSNALTPPVIRVDLLREKLHTLGGLLHLESAMSTLAEAAELVAELKKDLKRLQRSYVTVEQKDLGEDSSTRRREYLEAAKQRAAAKAAELRRKRS